QRHPARARADRPGWADGCRHARIQAIVRPLLQDRRRGRCGWVYRQSSLPRSDLRRRKDRQSRRASSPQAGGAARLYRPRYLHSVLHDQRGMHRGSGRLGAGGQAFGRPMTGRTDAALIVKHASARRSPLQRCTDMRSNYGSVLMRAALASLSTLLLLAYPAAQTRAAKALDIYVVDVEGGNAQLWVTPSGESMLVDTGNA